MPTILIEVLAIYRGHPDNAFMLTPAETYHVAVVFIRELRTVIVLNKDAAYRHQSFYSYPSWTVFTESWEIAEVLH